MHAQARAYEGAIDGEEAALKHGSVELLGVNGRLGGGRTGSEHRGRYDGESQSHGRRQQRTIRAWRSRQAFSRISFIV
jgi:hypothetical protein